MLVVQNPIQAYAWGQIDGIAHLVGTPPTGGPEAELWVGTHPRGPSTVAGAGEPAPTLAEVLAGGDGPARLPFLLKVLAIGEPLSLQAHPSAEQAAEGFAREEAAGIALDAPERLYRDADPKPEMLVALAPTDALCGFRPAAEAADLVAALEVEPATVLVEHLRRSEQPDALHDALAWILHVGPDDAKAISQRARNIEDHLAEASPAYDWCRTLARLHQGDAGCLASLLLNVVHLEPGDAIHLPAGNLHAYLTGAGVEIMASSDNVLRGGLTRKHVDVDELLAVLRFEAGTPAPPATRRVGDVTVYDAAERSFSLARIEAHETSIDVTRPSVLLPVGGGVVARRGADTVEAAPGEAAYVEPGATAVTVEATGGATVWWATTGDGHP